MRPGSRLRTAWDQMATSRRDDGEGQYCRSDRERRSDDHLLQPRPQTPAANQVFDNNVWINGSNTKTFADQSAVNGTSYNCTTFFSAWPDTNSACYSSAGFNNPAAEDFSLSANSVARGAAHDGSDAGALPYGSKTVF